MSVDRQISETTMQPQLEISKFQKRHSSLLAMLDRKSEIAVPDKKNTMKNRLKLIHVFLSYPAKPDQTILKGLSLDIKTSKTVALVAQSGWGASTMIGLMKHYIAP